jgi:hypothetical protein
MEREIANLWVRCENLNDAEIKRMSIQELFDLRHDLLTLKNKLEEFLVD